MENQEAALWYAKLGYSVIPLQPKGKKPLLEWKPYQQQRAEKEEISSWWQEWPEANVGIVTGAISGILVLDIDGWEGEQTIRYKGLYCPPSIISRTGGGNWHYLYRHPGFECRNFARQTGETLSRGLDFMGDGDYMVAPPSIHHSGNPYKWYVSPREGVPVDAPPWLLQLIQNQPRGKRDGRTEKESEKAREQRAEELTRRAHILLKKGIPSQEAGIILQAWSERRYSTPPPEEEVLEILQQVVKEKYIVLEANTMRMNNENESNSKDAQVDKKEAQKPVKNMQEPLKDPQKPLEEIAQIEPLQDEIPVEATRDLHDEEDTPSHVEHRVTVPQGVQIEDPGGKGESIPEQVNESIAAQEQVKPSGVETIPEEPEMKKEAVVEETGESISAEDEKEAAIVESARAAEETIMTEREAVQQDEAPAEETKFPEQEGNPALDAITPEDTDVTAEEAHLLQQEEVSTAEILRLEQEQETVLTDGLTILQVEEAREEEEEAPLEYNASIPVDRSCFVNTAAYLKNAFMHEYQRRMQEPLMESGLDKLDKALGGGFYPGLHLLGGDHSFGKTALAQQLADKIAARGHQVLFFSLEMGRYEMTCRSLARAYFEASGNREVTTGHFLRNSRNGENLFSHDQVLLIMENYQNGPGKNFTLVEGNGDMHAKGVRQLVNDHLALTGKKPVVIVDYLQAMIPLDWRMTEKQAVDFNVVELRRMARDLDIPVLALSLFQRMNRDNQEAFDALLESKTIASTADTVMFLQFRMRGEAVDNKELKNRNPRPLELVICKNRRGRAYEVIDLDYWPKHNYFMEV